MSTFFQRQELQKIYFLEIIFLVTLGGSEEDRKIYSALMEYMEEKRMEARELLKEENAKK